MSEGKITSIKFAVPAEGTDFGSEIPFEVKTEGLQEGARIDLRLCSSYRGSKNDGAGNISVTIKGGIGRGKCRVPLLQEWENDPVEKQARPLVEFWYVGSVAFTDISFAGEKIKVPTKESRQDFYFQHISSPNDTPRILVKSDTLRNPVPVNSSQWLSFHGTKSATESLELHIHDDKMLFGKPLKISLKEKMLEKGDPLCLLHTQFSSGNIGDMMGAYAPPSTTGVSIRPVLKPVGLSNGMKEENPIFVIDLKGNGSSAGLKQGKNNLSDTSDWGKRILCETIYGSDAVPGAIAIKETYPLLRDFIKGETFYIKTCKGRDYIILKGPSQYRKYIKGNRYSFNNAKIANLTVAKGYGSAMKSAFKWSEGTTIAFIFVGAMDLVEWMNTGDGQRYFTDLVVDIGSDLLQTVISSVAGALFAALVASVIPSVIVVVATGLVVAIGVGLALTLIDDRLKLTDQAKEKVRQCNSIVSDLFGDVFVKPFCNFLYQLEREAAVADGFLLP